MNLIIHNILAITSIIALCGMALFLFLNGKRKTINQVLGTTILFVIVFVVSHVAGVNISDPQMSRLMLMFNLSLFFVASTNIHAVLALIKKDIEYNRFIIFLYTSSALFVIGFCLLPDLFLLPSVPKMYFPNYYVPGILNWIRIAFMYLVAVPYMLYKLIDAYNLSKSEAERNQYRYFSIIIVVGYAVGFMPNFLVYNIEVNPLIGMSFAVLFAIPFIYAGLKYELFNIKVVAKQAFFYAISVGVVGGIITILNYSNELIVDKFPNYPTWVTAFISAIFTVTISFIVWRNFRRGDLLKNEFVTTVTHKFRTPLTGIKWATENLTNLPLTEEEYEQVSYIRSSTEKLVELTDILVSTSEAENDSYKYNFVKNDITSLTEKILESLSHQIHTKKLHITKNFGHGLIVPCDTTRIKFVIQTFIENAIHYTKSGGDIHITTKQTDNDVICSVHDTGIGMNENELNLVFSKFYRASEARAVDTEGMGIGLFIAKEIIKRHKGKIWTESEGLEKGSTFSFSLPKTK